MRRIIKNKEKIKEVEQDIKKEKQKVIRKKIIKTLVIIFIILISIFLILRYLGTSGLVVREYVVENDKINDNFYSVKIVHFSDIHYGNSTSMKNIENLVNKINYLKPDIVVFTGDLIYQASPSERKDLKINLEKLNSSLAKYMILGDKDNKETHKILLDAGFIDLNNTYDLIYKETNEPILISGIGSKISSRANIDDAMAYFADEGAQRDIFSIVITHEGDNLKEVLGAYPVDLALAGNSLNGQIRLPQIGGLIKVKGSEYYSDAKYLEKGAHIYISGGIGTRKIPFRLFNHPSINLIRLK